MMIVPFYSFKGGVGRSNALLNTAWLLARKKHFVVMLDMDIHAPGLTFAAEMQPPNPKRRPRHGLIDYLADFLQPMPGKSKPRPEQRLLRLEAMAYRPKLATYLDADEVSGDLMFIPCGRVDSDVEQSAYHDKLRELPLNKLNRLRLRGEDTGSLFEEICARAALVRSPRLGPEREPDFLLVDARTGFTEISDLIVGKGDHLVTLFGLNEQNQRGLEFLLKELLSDKHSYPLNNLPSRLSIIASPVPEGEETLKAEALGRMRSSIQRLARFDESRRAPEAMPEVRELPYHPFLALSEMAIARLHPESRPAKAYRELAEFLADLVGDTRSLSLRMRAATQAEVAGLLPEEGRSDHRTDHGQDALRHPVSITPPWNALLPHLPASAVLPPDYKPPAEIDIDQFLTLLASSVSLSEEDKRRVLQRMPMLTTFQFTELVRVFQEEKNKWFGLAVKHWDQIAALHGKAFAGWQALLLEFSPGSNPADLALALADVAVSLRLGPLIEYPAFWSALARTWYQAGWYQATATALEVAVELIPASGDLWTQYGEALRMRDRPKDGLAAFGKALELHTAADDKLGMANDHRGLAHLYLRTNRLTDAESAYRCALELHTAADDKLGMANDHRGLADLYLRTDRLADAESAYRRALELHTAADDKLGMANDHKGLADVYLRTNRLADAESAYRRALELHTAADDKLGMANDHNGLAHLYLRTSRLADAESAYRHALELHTASDDKLGITNDHSGLADVYLRTYRLADAETAYRRALELHTAADDKLGMAYDHKGMAHLYLRTDRLADAESTYRRALELHTAADDKLGMAYDQSGLADVYLRTYRLADAETAYRRALELHTTTDSKLGMANDHRGLADVYLSTDRLADAESAYRRALELHTASDSNLGMAYDHKGLAHLYLRTDRLADAESAYRRALELHTAADDKLGMAYDHKGLADLYLRTDRLADAESACRRAQELHTAADDKLGMAYDLRVQGEVLTAQGDLSRAESVLRGAFEGFETLADVEGQAEARRAQARLALARGQDGRKLFRAAQAMAERHGLTTLVREIGEEMARLGLLDDAGEATA